MATKILLVDDHNVVISGLKLLIKSELLKASTTEALLGDNVFDILKKEKFDLAILDLKMDDRIRLDIIRHIVDFYPQIKILVFSAFAEEIFALRLYKMGVQGFISKKEPIEEIGNAMQTVLNGKIYYSERSKELLLENLKGPKTTNVFDKLSNREMETMMLLIKGRNLKEIETVLNITKSTASTYKKRIMSKLNVANTMELFDLCISHELT